MINLQFLYVIIGEEDVYKRQWLYFLQQKTAQAAFSGPSVLCRIPYIKRRAAPKSRPPTIQAML